MSLKEKAKTDDLEIAAQLERILRHHSVEDADAFDRFYERLKIAESKLEDSQKEITEKCAVVAEQGLKACLELKEIYEHERLELKQKLQELYDKIIVELQQTPVGANWSESHFRSLLSHIAQKFGELLKEEKAKP